MIKNILNNTFDNTSLLIATWFQSSAVFSNNQQARSQDFEGVGASDRHWRTARAPFARVSLFRSMQNGSFNSHNTRKSLDLRDFSLVFSDGILLSVSVQILIKVLVD